MKGKKVNKNAFPHEASRIKSLRETFSTSRKNTLDERKKAKFLEYLSQNGNISLACMRAGVTVNSIYRHMRQYDNFRKDVEAAKDFAADLLEEEARRRACDGVIRNIYYQGVVVGQEREYSDSLLSLLLKGNKPDKFRERIDTRNINVDVKSIAELAEMTKDDVS